MEVTKIFKAFLKADRKQPHTPSETRLYFALLGLFQERANEKGQFAATLDEVCKRYGTNNKNHILQTRETLCKKGVLICTTKQRFSSVYTFVVGNKNVPTIGNKNVPTISSTPTTQESKVFAASTPFGKIEYHTEEAAREASIFCENAIRQFYSTNKLKVIQAFCLHWLQEDKKTKKPLFKTKQNFYLPYEFTKYKERPTE